MTINLNVTILRKQLILKNILTKMHYLNEKPINFKMIIYLKFVIHKIYIYIFEWKIKKNQYIDAFFISNLFIY